jgi:hypothetical protein
MLTVSFAVPGGPLLALPRVWRYVEQVVAEVQAARAVMKVA